MKKKVVSKKRITSPKSKAARKRSSSSTRYKRATSRIIGERFGRAIRRLGSE